MKPVSVRGTLLVIARNRLLPDSGTKYLTIAQQSARVFIEERVQIAR